jgi:hypothetical protein
VVAVEGAKTEPQYFNIFNDHNSVVHLKCLNSKHKSAAHQILKRITEFIQHEGLRKSDEAWLVVDKDDTPDDKLEHLFQWSSSKDNYGLALSNPKFEFWLLLHFEDGSGITSARDCSNRLNAHLPDYDKGIDVRSKKTEMLKMQWLFHGLGTHAVRWLCLQGMRRNGTKRKTPRYRYPANRRRAITS